MTGGPRRLPRVLVGAAAAAAPPPVGEQGACRTVSIGLQVLVGAGAGAWAWAWAAEGAGLRAAGSRTERGLRSGRSTSRRHRRRSPKPRASCSRRRCASPGPPRRQGPRARPPPAPRGLPGLGRSQVRSSSRGPGAPGPAFPRGPSRTPSPGAPNPPPASPKASPEGPARHGVGTKPGTGFGRRWWLESFVRSGWGRGPARGSVLGAPSGVPGGSQNRLPPPSEPGPQASSHFLTNSLRERGKGWGKPSKLRFWRQVRALTDQSKAIVRFCKLFVRLVTILRFFVFNS